MLVIRLFSEVKGLIHEVLVAYNCNVESKTLHAVKRNGLEGFYFYMGMAVCKLSLEQFHLASSNSCDRR